ncbi:MAG: helix-turn-helix domain-containing protein [Blastocatellia bacterium]
MNDRSLEQRVVALERILKPPQEPNVAETFGQRLRRLRTGMTLVQGKLCTAARISKGFLSDLERDNRAPSAETLHRLAQALRVSMDYLWTGRNE